MNSENRAEKSPTKRRWSDDETHVFLELMKSHKILSLLDGKRFRVKQVFSKLERDMQRQGFERDADQMIVKWKNLKAEYFKCKRHNTRTGTDPKTFAFFNDMQELLGERPSAEMSGVDTVDDPDNNDNNEADNLQCEENIIIEYIDAYEDLPQSDGERPGTSASTSCGTHSTSGSNASLASIATVSTSSTTHKSKSKKKSAVNELKKIITESRESDEQFLRHLFERQEAMLQNLTQSLMEGMKEIFNKKRPRRDSSDSE